MPLGLSIDYYPEIQYGIIIEQNDYTVFMTPGAAKHVYRGGVYMRYLEKFPSPPAVDIALVDLPVLNCADCDHPSCHSRWTMPPHVPPRIPASIASRDPARGRVVALWWVMMPPALPTNDGDKRSPPSRRVTGAEGALSLRYSNDI